MKEERALHWLSVGATPTESVVRLLEKHGTLARFERLKQGEPLETLVAEAEEVAQAAADISPKTRQEQEHAVPAAEEPALEPEVAEPETEPAEAGDEGEEETA